MERLTTDNPISTFETMMNYCYDRDGEALLVYADGEEEVSLLDYAVNCCNKKGCNTTKDEVKESGLECDCSIAIMYYLGLQAVETRRKLKRYEDTGLTYAKVSELSKAKQEGRLVVLPCKIGDAVWFLENVLNIEKKFIETHIEEYIVTEIRGNKYNPIWYISSSEKCKHRDFHPTSIGKTVFLTLEEAQQALKKRVASEKDDKPQQ